MSRKDYRVIAGALRAANIRAKGLDEANGVRFAFEEIAANLAAENMSFDYDLFWEAVYGA